MCVCVCVCVRAHVCFLCMYCSEVLTVAKGFLPSRCPIFRWLPVKMSHPSSGDPCLSNDVELAVYLCMCVCVCEYFSEQLLWDLCRQYVPSFVGYLSRCLIFRQGIPA